MFDELNYSGALEKVVELFTNVSRKYALKVAAQIKRIGEMNQTSVNRLIVFQTMGADVHEIKNLLADATGLGTLGMMSIFQSALNDTYTDPRFADFVREKAIPKTLNAQLNQYAAAVARQTADSLANLSNTTAVSSAYQAMIDQAIFATSSGLTDYESATREIVEQLGNGLQVQYASGYRRRLDSAVRQNITNATKQLAQQSAQMMGDQLGFDAYEISAHLRSAPDHEPVQGRVILKEEFAKMQAGASFVDADGRRYTGFRRPIGEWNCRHSIAPFYTQHSIRTYSDAQLAAFAAANQTGCTIDGKHYTIYAASQLMRDIETQIRQEKETAVVAQAAGNAKVRQQCQTQINALSRRYRTVAQAAGIREDRGRMTIPGFKPVKTE